MSVERKPCHCPECGKDWSEGQSIPVESLGYYGGEHGVPMDCEYGCGRPRHYEGALMCRVWNDRVQSYMCMGCGAQWSREEFSKMREEIKESVGA